MRADTHRLRRDQEIENISIPQLKYIFEASKLGYRFRIMTNITVILN